MSTQIFLIMICLAGSASAEPNITGWQGNISDGESIIISGSGFGNIENISPIKWDDFEKGSHGIGLSNVSPEWRDYFGGSKFCSNHSHSGELSVCNDFSEHAFSTNFFQFSPREEIYVTYWYRTANCEICEPQGVCDYNQDCMERVDPYDYGVIKLSRIISSEDGNVYHGVGTTGVANMNPCYDSGPHVYWNNGYETVYPEDRGVEALFNEWMRVETYSKLSNPAGASNGKVFAEIVAEGRASVKEEVYDNVVTRAENQTFQLDTVILGLMDGAHFGEFELYLDDIYISDTLARIEIGNNQNYSECTHREIQIPETWSADEIAIDVNQGSIQQEDRVYLFVIDEHGNASEGYPVTIQEVFHEADSNQDGEVDNGEIRDYIAQWRYGKAAMDGLFSALSAWSE